jgi:hypothetical protein
VRQSAERLATSVSDVSVQPEAFLRVVVAERKLAA